MRPEAGDRGTLGNLQATGSSRRLPVPAGDFLLSSPARGTNALAFSNQRCTIAKRGFFLSVRNQV